MNSGCPCTLLEVACSSQCTCKSPDKSGGCRCCAQYGSDKQRLATARRIFSAVMKSSSVLEPRTDICNKLCCDPKYPNLRCLLLNGHEGPGDAWASLPEDHEGVE